MTGTDTDVGKTVVSTTLLQAAACRGLTTAGYKPVASGSRLCAGALCNDDALALQAASSLQLRYAQVNPYTFAEATAPHIVSAEAETPSTRGVSAPGCATCSVGRSGWSWRGGWLVYPLSLAYGFNSWVASEKLPVILTVGVKLGCINHALLSAHAIESAGLRLAGWVANQVQTPGLATASI